MAKQNDEERERRVQQLEKVRAHVQNLEERQEEYKSAPKQLSLLKSVSLGLYDELDKLTKKAPSEPVTDLALGQLNDVIRETKDLVSDDVYVQRLSVFEPAGDNPQHRDAIVVMRLVREGLNRYGTQLDGRTVTVARRLDMARLLKVSLQLYLEGDEAPTRDQVEEELDNLSVQISSELISSWFQRGDSTYTMPGDCTFNLARLDKLNMERDFSLE